MEACYGTKRLNFYAVIKDGTIRGQLLSSLNIRAQTPTYREEGTNSPTIQHSCRFCDVSFPNISLFRSHCKTDDHIANVRRLAVAASDEDSAQSAENCSFIVSSLKGESLRIWLKVTDDDSNSLCYGFLKALVTRRDASRSDPLDVRALSDIISLGSNVTYAVILVTAGHFSGAVFKGDQPLIHKAFHRYVVRAKQGHAQSKRDGSGNRCHSGGSSLRRHNEVAFIADIQELLSSWSADYLSTSRCIFVHCPHRMISVFFDKETGSLRLFPEKIRNIPFSVGRPTFELCREVAQRLFTVCLIDEAALADLTKPQCDDTLVVQASEDEDSDIDLFNFWTAVDVLMDDEPRKCETKLDEKSMPSAVLPSVSSVKGAKTSERIFDEMYTCCRGSDANRLNLLLGSFADNVADAINKQFGLKNETLLHISSNMSKSGEVVQSLLAAGCDPSIKDLSGMVAYEVACDDSIRNVFINFRRSSPEKFASWDATKIPSESRSSNDHSKKKRRSKKNKEQVADVVVSNSKIDQGKPSKLDGDDTERNKFLKLKDEDKRLMKGVNRCFMCGKKYENGSSFDYSFFKFCSVQCLRTHRHDHKEL